MNTILGLSVVAISIISLLFTNLQSAVVFFWVFLFSMYAWNINSRVSIAGALLFLNIIPILLILKKLSIVNNIDGLTEQITVWVFYFLTIGVTKQIWEMYQEEEIDEIIESKAVTVPSYTFKPTLKKTTIKTIAEPKVIHDIKPPAAKKKI
jgi:hypothetical protein